MTLSIAVSGAGGLVGSALAGSLGHDGHRVVRLVRRESAGRDEVRWDPGSRTIDAAALEGLDAVVHLAGENIAARRWSSRMKSFCCSPRSVRPAAAINSPPDGTPPFHHW